MSCVRFLSRCVVISSLLCSALIWVSTAKAQSNPVVPSRVVEHVDDTRLVRLPGNTQLMARQRYDKGLVDPAKELDRIMLVLKRSPEQEAALTAFNERQYDPQSSDFHHWLSATEFGQLYGPSDSDIAQITSWLQNHGFSIYRVSKGRVTIEFSGTVAQVQDAFHLEMHNYLVDGKMHIANDRDPSIPAALLPVVTGIASLNDFFPTRTHRPKLFIKRDLKTGKYSRWKPSSEAENAIMPPPPFTADPGSLSSTDSKGDTMAGGVHPDFVFKDPNVDPSGFPDQVLAPYDVATIYNILPLWQESTPIDGTGITVAIVGRSDVSVSDFNTFRSSFALPAGTLTTLHDGPDPGIQPNGDQGENTLDTEMVSSTAPGAKVILVSNADTATTSGLAIGVGYIIENNIAPILTMSYLECELGLGTAGNSFWSQIFQEATSTGITPFVCSDDSGSAGCTNQNGITPPYGDQYGLEVNGMASNPYVTAVGGSDLQWYLGNKPFDTYWNLTNDPKTGASAKGYMPEMAWNTSCTNPLLLGIFSGFTSSEQLCNAAITEDPYLVGMGSGGGGVSACTTNDGQDPSSCSGGYAKPSWQKSVPGIPADGKRDVPDVVMFGSYGFSPNTTLPQSALMICQSDELESGACNYSNPNSIIYEINGGTSAATPMTAGIMAMILQKSGSRQGLANPVLYGLAAKENYSSCNSNNIAAGNSCIFNDITTGANAMVCYTGDPNCVTHTSGDKAGVLNGYSATAGYDLTTGLGSLNVANLVNAWPGGTTPVPAITLSPTKLTFASTTVGSTSAAQVVTVKNTGTATATLTSETLTGTDSTDYLISAKTCTASLAVNATCTVSVEFKPAVAGTLTASLSIADNATGSPQTVALTGTGAAGPTFTVSLSPTSLTFASTKVGTTTAAQLVTIKNTGTGTVTLSSETITGTNPTSFLKSATTCGTSLAAGATCTVSVEFKPAATGALKASLSIADNATGTPQTVALTGTGATSATPTVTLTPTSIAFANTIVGSTSDAQIVTVKNTGTVTATISAIALGGANATSFLELGNCGTTLAAGASCSLYVAFKPASAAALGGLLSVTDNASGSPQKVTLTGTGTAAPSVKLSATSIAFPTTLHGTTSAAQTVTLTNAGTATLDLTSITLAGANPTDFEALNTCGPSLAAGANCVVYVAFKPATAAAFKATLTITDNGSASPQSVALSGTGH